MNRYRISMDGHIKYGTYTEKTAHSLAGTWSFLFPDSEVCVTEI